MSKLGSVLTLFKKKKINFFNVRFFQTPLTNLTGFREAEWYHFTCFFARILPRNVTDFSGFYLLRTDDQEKIQKIVDQSRTMLGQYQSLHDEIISTI